MRKILLPILLLSAVISVSAQTAEMFRPYKTTNLRLPSVPLVVSDPYFSVWSPYDKLTDGSTRHWTNDEKPLEGLLRVDGTTYRFMGSADSEVLQTIMPMADEEAWTARLTRRSPGNDWQQPDFDDKSWKDAKGAFGSEGENVRTSFNGDNADIYLRRTVNLSADDLTGELYLVYSHDDVFELYLNGKKIIDTGKTWFNGVRLKLDANMKSLLKPGRNIIAAHCHNTDGGAYTDFGLYKVLKDESADNAKIVMAEQKQVSVLATSTYYTFKCGPVDLNLVFTAPMLIDDLDLLSTPANYISYQAVSNDGREHSVQFYLSANPLQAVNSASQPTVSTAMTHDGMRYLKTGTVNQPVLAKKGDGICIDWGYFYMPAFNGKVSLGSAADIKSAFQKNGALPASADSMVCRKASEMPALAYVHDFGTVKSGRSYMMVGYDEVQDIEYMYNRYKGYWAHEGKVSIFDAFKKLNDNYTSIMNRCRDLDKRIYDDGMAAGNVKYAEILSGSYRHVIAAHKLFKDNEGNLLFFSKENNSNGCVNTVDLTYPEAPLFLCYNPELQKAMMTSIFEYSYTGRWTKPFAAHDLGTYPIADGQAYGGDGMPVEESGNMLTLAAMLTQLDGNTKYVDKYWHILQTWADYLVENGQDPANQLCTDDFAGHWAHNCNLSAKAIMGVAGFALMAKQKGDDETAKKYMSKAKEMGIVWEKNARDGDHYRLAFDQSGTWSQKYNMVWDKLWKTDIFPDVVFSREIKYYLGKQNKYGLPLDCRKDYTKNDWIMWTATMSPDKKTFLKFVAPVYDYVNETSSRVPLSDWYDTKTAKMQAFKARSVIGGFWMRVLADKLSGETAGVR
jgi:hypothetical protein